MRQDCSVRLFLNEPLVQECFEPADIGLETRCFLSTHYRPFAKIKQKPYGLNLYMRKYFWKAVNSDLKIIFIYGQSKKKNDKCTYFTLLEGLSLKFRVYKLKIHVNKLVALSTFDLDSIIR